MDGQLRKRLEEAATEYIERNYKDSIVPDWNEKDFIAGGEWIFKEVITLAKEWLLENTISHYIPNTDARWVDTNECEDSKEFAYRFESDMNKLLEEKK